MTEKTDDQPKVGEDGKPIVTEPVKTETDQGTFKEAEAPKEEPVKETPKEEPTKEEPVKEELDENAELDSDVWGSTGDDVGDSVLQMLQNAGTTPDTAKALLWDAVQAGDVTKIDRDALVEAVGKTKATLIMAGMENYVGNIAKRAAEVTGIVNEAVGGKDNWVAIRDWAKTALSDSDMADYADMIDKGGRKASLAAKDLKEQYEAAGHTFSETTEQITPSGKPAPTTLEPLSKRQYFEATEKLHKTGQATKEATDKLWQQRQLGITQGK